MAVLVVCALTKNPQKNSQLKKTEQIINASLIFVIDVFVRAGREHSERALGENETRQERERERERENKKKGFVKEREKEETEQ